MGVKAVGIELEGGWIGKNAPFLSDKSPSPLTHDVSVQPPEGWVKGMAHWGECVVPGKGIPPGEAVPWLLAHYPSHVPKTTGVGSPQEKSVGLHIHVSFEEKEWMYRACAQMGFRDHILKGFAEWGEKMKLPPDHIFWHRWRGGNRFCKRDFTPAIQMRMTGKGHNNQDRRTQINFSNYMDTIEFRMLPMFPDARLSGEEVKKGDREMAAAAVTHYLALVEGWLKLKEVEEKSPQTIFKVRLAAWEREGARMERTLLHRKEF